LERLTYSKSNIVGGSIGGDPTPRIKEEKPVVKKPYAVKELEGYDRLRGKL